MEQPCREKERTWKGRQTIPVDPCPGRFACHTAWWVRSTGTSLVFGPPCWIFPKTILLVPRAKSACCAPKTPLGLLLPLQVAPPLAAARQLERLPNFLEAHPESGIDHSTFLLFLSPKTRRLPVDFQAHFQTCSSTQDQRTALQLVSVVMSPLSSNALVYPRGCCHRGFSQSSRLLQPTFAPANTTPRGMNAGLRAARSRTWLSRHLRTAQFDSSVLSVANTLPTLAELCQQE